MNLRNSRVDLRMSDKKHVDLLVGDPEFLFHKLSLNDLSDDDCDEFESLMIVCEIL
jgi:hypothetical protein